MKVYKVVPGKGLNPCIEKDISSVLVWLEESEIGDEIVISTIDMSEEDYNSLPEYMGP